MNKNALIPRRKVLGLGVALAGLCAGCAVLPDAGSAESAARPGRPLPVPAPVLRKRHRGPSLMASTCGTTRSSTPFTTTAAW